DDVLYGCAKAIKKASGDSGVEFKVILDESNVGKKAHSRQSSAKNFFYDSQLMNSLSLGSVHGKDVNQCSELSESDDDLEPFEKLARNMEDLTGDGGVVKKVVTPGVGGELTAGTTVRFHYSNYFEYGDEPMDSTYLRNKMAKSKIGQGDVLPGLVVALASMRLKETAQFIFKPVYAYGK
ncbi:FKBP-type peptidyl-prolyl cis-trans isomerase domain, partial [Trinorchestia longiramus]